MILTCHSCSTRLALDDAKVPAGAFTVRCAKCGSVVDGQAANVNHAAHANGSAPTIASGEVNDEVRSDVRAAPQIAASFVAEQNGADTGASGDDMLRVLAEFMREAMEARQSPAPGDGGGNGGNGSRRWELKRALVCVQPEHREQVARCFAANDYEVFVEADATSAIKRMREEHLDVIVLAPEFDQAEQGALFITREISALRMGERRRVFIIQLSATARTVDAHAAFINSVNLIVNAAELDRLPGAFNRSLREFRELYYDYNKSIGAPAR